ncbi:MAG: aminoglycoside phosphotransferase family protein [Acidobacteriia bacterium]|nr:aminoglycoside phosphotransferase family protein [Terriglobia bacterium]
MGIAEQKQWSSMGPPMAEGLLSDSGSSKQALAQKASEFISAEFIASRICPKLGPGNTASASDCDAKIIQNTGTGRLTLRYTFGPDNVVYAKLYGDELGAHCYQANLELWNNGFNKSGRYQVPEPLGFIAEHSLLFMRGVPGTPLGAVFDGDTSIDLVSGSGEAAEWLAAMHLSSLSLGAPDSDWDSLKLFRMASRVIKAAAARPEKLDMVREVMDQLEQRVAQLAANRYFVCTHGRYHHDHVFLSPVATSVIDLDRCRPSDPAKDAAEFVRVLRLTAFKEGYDMERAERATTAFLTTYLAKVPRAAESLGCYWAVFVFHSLLGGLKKSRNKGEKSWEQLEEFYLQEIKRALEFCR